MSSPNRAFAASTSEQDASYLNNRLMHVLWVQRLEGKEGGGEDLLYVNEAVTYSSILIKVFVMMEYAVKTGARWLLKTDDDAYVNVPQTVQVHFPLLVMSALP
jgi:hypothetical protein